MRARICGVTAVSIAAALICVVVARGGRPPQVAANGKIAFSSDRGIQAKPRARFHGPPPPPPPPPRRWDIHTINADGTDFVQLTTLQEPFALAPAWSPDGTRIAFHASAGSSYDIFVVDADGTNRTNLTNSPDSLEFDPAWSPNGEIAFESDRYGSHDLFVMDARGSNVRRLTTDPASEYQPAWSPDGRWIAFGSDRADLDPEIYVFDTTTREVARLTSHLGWDGDAAWSPDGTAIAFDSDRNGLEHIFLMNPDGSNVRQLPAGPVAVRPAWSPDGTKVAFDDFEDIFVMKADGTEVQNVTNSFREDREPSWQPIPITPPPPEPPPPPRPPPPPPPPPPLPPPPPPRRSCVVPRVIGLRFATARRRIQRAHCRIGRVLRAHSRRSRAGRVIRQSPRPGAVRSVNWRVTLVIGRR